jgi:hypothetical protein
MKRNLFGKGLVVGIVVLFIGVVVQPAYAVDTKQSIDDNMSEDCKECNEVSDANLIKLKSLLNRIEQRTKLLLVLSKNNPEIKDNYDKLADTISKLNTLGLREAICIWLSAIIIDIMFNILPYYLELIYEYWMAYRFILSFLTSCIFMMYVGLWATAYTIYLYILKCGDILTTHLTAKELGVFTPYFEVVYEKLKNHNIQNQFFLPILERWWNIE